MRHDSVVSRYAIPTGISQVDGWSMGPPGFEESHTPRETPTTSSLVAAMFAEELRLYNQFSVKISLETSDDVTTSTIREAKNALYFIREQFAARLCFPVPSLVKQFLHFTQAPPTLVHPNAFWILMGCSVLNSL